MKRQIALFVCIVCVLSYRNNCPPHTQNAAGEAMYHLVSVCIGKMCLLTSEQFFLLSGCEWTSSSSNPAAKLQPLSFSSVSARGVIVRASVTY